MYHNESSKNYFCFFLLQESLFCLTLLSVACPPNHIDGHTYNLYLVPKNTTDLGDFLTKTYGIDIDWTYGQSIEIAPCIDNYW